VAIKVTANNNQQNPNGKRLNKYISESGFCSRRGADKLIEENRVTINGKIPELGSKVQTGDVVKVDGKAIAASASNKSDRIYLAYNKPTGITCTTERHVRGNIIDAINHRQRIFPIGRLDKPSEGLIFLTSDGDIVNKILRAENAHDKEYLVTVDKPLSERFALRMQRGVPILGTVTKPCVVTIKSRFVFTIVLTQGLNRQIRRMCEYLGYEVTKLKRTRIMSVDLKGLKVGQWRDLSEQEMAEINNAVATSSKTAVTPTMEETEGVEDNSATAINITAKQAISIPKQYQAVTSKPAKTGKRTLSLKNNN
jgi:23S rRNA pseudouridine2604 synthase